MVYGKGYTKNFQHSVMKVVNNILYVHGIRKNFLFVEAIRDIHVTCGVV
jgi:hypothetical protein